MNATVAMELSALSGTQRQLAEYLGNGVRAADAAAAVGVSDSYVSQLLSTDDAFRAVVASLKSQKLGKFVEMDTTADRVQLNVLQRLERAVAMEAKPAVLARVLDSLDRMKRRSAGTDEGRDANSSGIVRITLPAAVRQQYQISVDVNNKVVQIDTSTMVPATGAMIDIMAEEVRNHERGTEAGVLQLPAAAVRGNEAHNTVPAAARTCATATGTTAAEA